MKICSVCKKLRVVPGNIDTYNALSHYHYRASRPGPLADIYALEGDSSLVRRSFAGTIGVIVYTMPPPNSQLRSVATGGIFAGLDNTDALDLINKNVRRISRVIIEPRFRSLGLAARLVRETMPMLNIPIVEAMAVMGIVNPFFEKAGMKPFAAPAPERCIRLTEAFSAVGIEQHRLIDAERVQYKLDRLQPKQSDFIEFEIRYFLKCYRGRRTMPPGPERTRFILSRLTERPVYYIWLNKNLELRM